MIEIFFPITGTWAQIERWCNDRNLANWSVCPTWISGVCIQLVRAS